MLHRGFSHTWTSWCEWQRINWRKCGVGVGVFVIVVCSIVQCGTGASTLGWMAAQSSNGSLHFLTVSPCLGYPCCPFVSEVDVAKDNRILW